MFQDTPQKLRMETVKTAGEIVERKPGQRSGIPIREATEDAPPERPIFKTPPFCITGAYHKVMVGSHSKQLPQIARVMGKTASIVIK